MQRFAGHPSSASKGVRSDFRDARIPLQGWRRKSGSRRRPRIGPDVTVKVVSQQDVTDKHQSWCRKNVVSRSLLRNHSGHGQVATICAVSSAVAFQHPNCGAFPAIRSGSGGAVNDKWLYCSGLQLLAEGARLLLSWADTPWSPASHHSGKCAWRIEKRLPPRLSS